MIGRRNQFQKFSYNGTFAKRDSDYKYVDKDDPVANAKVLAEREAQRREVIDYSDLFS